MISHRLAAGRNRRAARLLSCIAACAVWHGAAAYAQTATWDGGSGASDGWSHAQNWNPNGVPASNGSAEIVMAGTTRLTPDVDEAWDVHSITFASNAGQFHIGGQTLTIRADGITNNHADTQSIGNAILLGTNQTWTAAAGPLVLSGSVRPLDSNTLLTVGGLFNSTLSGPLLNSFNGNGILHLAKTGTGTLVLSGANTYSGDTTVTAGTVSFTQSYRRSAGLDIAGGAKIGVTPRTAGVKTLQTGALTLDPTGTLDMADNDLVIGLAAFTTIQSLVLAGFGNPSGGITSSTSNGSQILALFDNSLVGAGTWNGATIATNSIVGKYTYFGDANIDGQVTGDDYTVIDANLNTDPAVGLEWLSGDANLDGIVTGDDYTVIDANLGLGVGNPLVLSAVPEPVGFWVGMGGAIALMRRRRA